jgi:hypothetical protein
MSAIELLPSFTGYEVGDIYAEAELNGEALYRGRSRKAPNSRVQIERCQMNENLMRPSGPGSPCPLKELLSQLESKAPGNKLRLPRRV